MDSSLFSKHNEGGKRGNGSNNNKIKRERLLEAFQKSSKAEVELMNFISNKIWSHHQYPFIVEIQTLRVTYLLASEKFQVDFISAVIIN